MLFVQLRKWKAKVVYSRRQGQTQQRSLTHLSLTHLSLTHVSHTLVADSHSFIHWAPPSLVPYPLSPPRPPPAPAHARARALSLSLSLSHSLSLSLLSFLSPLRALLHTHTYAHTHIRTHARTHTHTRTHTQQRGGGASYTPAAFSSWPWPHQQPLFLNPCQFSTGPTWWVGSVFVL